MSMLRKKKSTFDESDLPTDNWIWGNTRGGGGAPLKDVQGNDVANLKKVLTGTIEVDHSPSPNGKARRNNQAFRDTEYDDRDGGYNNKQNSRNPPANAPNRNGNNRNRQGGYDSNNVDEYDRRGGRNDRNHNQRNNNDQRNNNNNKPRYNPYSDEAPERIIPGLNDHHSPVHHPNNNHRNPNNMQNGPNSPRYVDNNNGASPKKFMGALRELTGGSNSERDAKQRKQAEYQEMLRQQIEDNNRKKEKEKREKDEVKRKELAEFMSTQGVKSGAKAASVAADDIPPSGAANNNNNNKRNPPQGRFRADSDDEYNNNSNNNNKEKNGSKMPSLNVGGGGNTNKRGNNNNYYSEDEQDEPPVRRGQGGPDKGRQVPGIAANRRQSSSYDSDPNQDQDYPPRRSGNNNGGGNRGGGGGYDSEGSGDSRNNGGGRGNGGRGGAGRGRGSVSSAMSEDVVPVEEYDELSKLVDKLLTEKAQLQLAVEKQADQLKALKGGKAAPNTNPRNRLVSSPSKPALARSRSAMQPRVGARGAKGQLDLPMEEPPARAASNLRTSKKELDRERAREARAHLKEYEPVKKNAAVGGVNKARPSSMHAIGGSKGYTDDAGQPKKAVKVAFGSNRNLDKNNAGASNRLAQQGASVLNSAHGNNKGKVGINSPSKDNTAQGRYGQGGVVKAGRVSAGGAMGERDNIGINGFAKLQQANSRVVGGPVMVVHEDEEPSGRGYNNNKHNSGYGDSARTPSPLQRGKGGNARVGSLELRGNSEYIPIDNNKDVIGNDQLERLLRQSRNAR
eukprot:gene9146-10795_t